MAGSFSDFMEKKILDVYFGATAYSAPGTLFVGLATATITDATTGSTVTEPSGNAYARVSVTNNTTNFPNATGTTATKQNGTAITFPTATGSWGTVTDFFIADASTVGNILCYGTLTTSKTVSNGDVVSFAVSQITLTLD
jgi:hypothetical protein